MSSVQEKTIVVIANKYPNTIEHNVNVFTQQLTWCFADLGYKCIVICPMPINFNLHYLMFPTADSEYTTKGNKVKICLPKYFSLGQRQGVFTKARVSYTTWAFTKTVERELNRINSRPWVLFAEFLCPAGVAVADIGEKYGVPSYMQIGEAEYQGDVKYGNNKLKKKLANLTGAIALSGQNRDYLVNSGIVAENKIIVSPSGYREDLFFPRDKYEARKKMGFPEDKFIVGFCGTFDERKGVNRLEKAVDKSSDIYMACVGYGKYKPTSAKCLFAEPLDHDKLPWFFSALDIYVMPTYQEGCCTAIVEAIACGCPIISSNRSFNYEICTNQNSILIDPDDIDGISNAMLKLKNDQEMLQSLKEGSIEEAKNLSLDKKAQALVKYFESNEVAR